MSRSGYSDNWDDNWRFILYRGHVASAIRGKRGQRFLRDLISALDAMPEKKLISHAVAKDGCYCAMGAVGAARGMTDEALEAFNVDPYDDDGFQTIVLGRELNIASALAREVAFINDDGEFYHRPDFTEEQRWHEVRAWAVRNLREEKS